MASLSHAIADAVATDLNAQSFSVSFTAVRAWAARWTLAELAKALQVTIVPSAARYEANTLRGRDVAEYDVLVAVQRKVAPKDGKPDNAVIDPLADLTEDELRNYFRLLRLTADGKTIVCVEREWAAGAEAGVDPEQLDDQGVFTAVLKTTWKVLS